MPPTTDDTAFLVRLPLATKRALDRAVLENKEQARQPQTLAGIVREACDQWLARRTAALAPLPVKPYTRPSDPEPPEKAQEDPPLPAARRSGESPRPPAPRPVLLPARPFQRDDLDQSSWSPPPWPPPPGPPLPAIPPASTPAPRPPKPAAPAPARRPSRSERHKHK